MGAGCCGGDAGRWKSEETGVLEPLLWGVSVFFFDGTSRCLLVQLLAPSAGVLRRTWKNKGFSISFRQFRFYIFSGGKMWLS